MATQTIDLTKVENNATVNVIDNAIEVKIADTTLNVEISDTLNVANVAGEAHIGEIGGSTICIDVSPILTVHANYVANDYVGTSALPITFSGSSRVNGGTGMVVGGVLIDNALQSVAGELWLFDTAPTPPADSAAWTIVDEEADRCIGIIPFNTYYASALNSIAPVNNLTIAFQTLAASRSIYGCFVTRGAPSYASGDLVFRLHIIQD
jgi:hypothetical protein